MEIRKILVPTDFSSCADAALERAAELAKLTNAEIHVLHAYALPTPAPIVGIPLVIPEEFYAQVRDATKKGVDQRVGRAAAQGLKVAGSVVCDTPARAILDAAAKLQADLIVMGTHGHTGLKHVLLGSVAERTVRLASCPVMTVKPASGA